MAEMTQRWERDRHGRVWPLPKARPHPLMVTYPFPLHAHGGTVFARFVLPADLTAREAERLKAFILALATDEADD